MRVTIEIEPEEAARFVKAFVPTPLGFAEQLGANSFAQHIAGTTNDDFVKPWSDAIEKWYEKMGGIQK